MAFNQTSKERKQHPEETISRNSNPGHSRRNVPRANWDSIGPFMSTGTFVADLFIIGILKVSGLPSHLFEL